MGDNRDVVLATLAKSFIRNLDNRRYYSTYVDVIHENQLFGTKKTSAVHDVVAEINSSLNSSKHRLEAVCLLQEVISQCATDIFTQNAVIWLRLLTQALKSHDPVLTMEMTCDITCNILQQAAGFPELSRDVASNIIPGLVAALLDMPAQHLECSLKCLSACMSHFSGSCGPFKNKIEAKVVPLLDGNHKNIEDVTCGCYNLLAMCGGGGSQGVKHSEAWSAQIQRLIGSINDTLSTLLQAVHMGMEETPDTVQRLVLCPVAVEEPAHTCTLHARYTCLVKALITMLSSKFPATVKVPVDDILQVVCRALSVTPKQVMFHATQERVLLCSVLPLLQGHAFRLIRALISSCKSHLVMHCGTINKLFVQTLNWSTAETQYGHRKPYSGLRTEIYETLSLWVQTVGAASGTEHVMSDIMTHWVKDVTPEANIVKLDSRISQKVDTLMMGGGNSKKKRRLAANENENLSGQRKVALTANYDVCSAALQAMRHILLRIGPFLKAKHHKSIHGLIIPILLDVHQGTAGQQGAPPPPYRSVACRIGLYQVLLAEVLCPHTAVAPPLPCAVRLFSRGQQDEDTQVASVCSEAAAVAEVLCHPRVPTLSTPPTQQVDDNHNAPAGGVFNIGFYGGSGTAAAASSAGFAPGYVYSVGKEVPPPGGVAMVLNPSKSQLASGKSQQCPQPMDSEDGDGVRHRGQEERDIEVVSLASSDSDKNMEDEEEGEDSSNEEEQKEQEDKDNAESNDEDIIAIEDDSNSPKPSTSSATQQTKQTTSSSPQKHKDTGGGGSDCEIIHEQVERTRDSEETAVQSSGSVAMSTKRKHTEVGDANEKDTETTGQEEDGTQDMLAAFVDAGPDSD